MIPVPRLRKIDKRQRTKDQRRPQARLSFPSRFDLALAGDTCLFLKPVPEEPLHNPHDRFFKKAFLTKKAAADFLRDFLPPGLSTRLSLDTLERRPGSFVDEALRERHSDLLFKVRWNEGGDLFVYVLFEHQSEEDPLMAFRLLVYMVRIWTDLLREKPARKRLPLIVPIVLHQNDSGWKACRRFGSLIELPEGTEEDVADLIPDFAFNLVDLVELPVEEIRGSVLVRAILATMKVARSGDLLERLPELAPLLSAAWREEDAAFVRVCLEYLMRGSGDIDLQRFRVTIEQLEIGEIKDDVMSLADQLIQEGRQKGEAALLERQLALRFGELPQWARRRLENASVGELERWGERVLDAPALEAVFK